MPRVPIFTFHAVDEGSDLVAYPPRVFERAMARLHDLGWSCLRVVDIAWLLRSGQALPDRSFALTFDDGYASVFERAAPVLERFGFAATLFVSVGVSGGSNSTQAGPTGTQEIPSLEGRKMLTWDRIRSLQAAGWEIGAHGCRHVALTGLSSDEVEREITRSARRIEEEVDEAVRGFSYPFGRFDDAVRAQVLESGLDYAVSDVMGEVTDDSDVFALERVETWYLRGPRRFDWATGARRGVLFSALRGVRAVRRAGW